jgi:uncharacterized protein YuzE
VERYHTTLATLTGSNKQLKKLEIQYTPKTDVLYLRLDDRKQQVMNRRVSEDVVLDVGKDDRIVGIENLDASKHLKLEKILPVKYAVMEEQ